MSFHRLDAARSSWPRCSRPGLAFVVGELAPGATARQLEIQKAKQTRPTRSRFNFVYRGDAGWVYTIRSLDVSTRQLKQLLFERQGSERAYPDLIITADSASYDDSPGPGGSGTAPAGSSSGPTSRRCSPSGRMRLRALTQSPADLLAEPKAPDEMRYAELGRYIDALKRSGNDANKLIVEQALKLALPATCIIIALFGAPLAVTTPAGRRRGGRGDQPRHDRALPAHHPDHEGGGGRRRDRPDRGGLAAELPSSSWRGWCCSRG